MKYRLKNKKVIIGNVFVVFILVMAISSVVITSSYLKEYDKNIDTNSTSVIKTDKNIVRSPKIDEYIDTLDEQKIVEEVDIKKEVTSILTTENDKYESHIFNYETGKEITITELIKEDKIDDFWNKIKELVYLKYPTFIADVISLNNGNNEYFLKDNELVIYYYDYTIDPMPKEDLFLVVNYNEIKDYLNITVDLDSNYVNEDGSVINPSKKLVAITFDDGPGPYTNDLVNILKNNKAICLFNRIEKSK